MGLKSTKCETRSRIRNPSDIHGYFEIRWSFPIYHALCCNPPPPPPTHTHTHPPPTPQSLCLSSSLCPYLPILTSSISVSSISVCQSVFLRRSLALSVLISLAVFALSINISVCICWSVSLCLPLSLSLSLSGWLSMSVSAFVFDCLSACLPAYLSVCLSPQHEDEKMVYIILFV